MRFQIMQNKILPTIFVVLLSACQPVSVSDTGQVWTRIGITADSSTTTLTIDPKTPTTLYAGTEEGVFQSTDGGGNWSQVGNDLMTPADVSVLAIDPVTPTTLYAGTNGSGVFKSTDGGASWREVNSGLKDANRRYVRGFVIDPVMPTTLYAGTDDGVYKSTDGGNNWSQANVGLPKSTIGALTLPKAPLAL
jgi:photosystem II stability/assembly factor-like uncharacterized protein